MAIAAETPGGSLSILSPDFYDYDWTPLSSATIVDDFVLVRWPDGVELKAYKLWLRENAVGVGGVDRATREGLLDPADLDATERIKAARVATSGALEIDWEHEKASVSYHPGWLRHVAEGKHRADAWVPSQQSWTAAEWSAPPTHEAAGFDADRVRTLEPWVDDLLRYGIARLRNLPVDLGTCLRVAETVGAVRDTNFGRTWDVKADIEMAGAADTNSTANTNLRLGPHTDLPTRETPPGFQFLFCYANDAQGGYSTMTDGLAVVRYLEANHAEHFEALTTLHWVFFNRGPGIDHRWSGPFIDLGVAGAPLTLRAFYPVRGFPDMDPVDMPRAYEAMSVFSRLAASDEFQMRYPFEPGDLVGFDNRRILHGRDAFTAGGYRHLRGAYVDHDEIYSFARVANRRAASVAHYRQG